MQLRIDADAFFRALTATGYKLLAFQLNRTTGEVVSRTLAPGEVIEEARGPSVAPLPKNDPTIRTAPALFTPEDAAPKKKLFDDDGPKKSAFGGDFWQRGDSKKLDPFGDGGHKRESGTKKLAEIFGEAPAKKKADPFEKPAAASPPAPPGAGSREPGAGTREPATVVIPSDPNLLKIPVVSEAQHLEWMRAFAKDAGDPDIRDAMFAALKTAKPAPAFERVLRQHQRTGQQWERYFRKKALAFGEAWLSDLGVAWEIVEKE